MAAELCSLYTEVRHTYLNYNLFGASLSEPHTGQTASPAMFIYLYVYRYVSYVIPYFHWTASILISVNSVNATMFKYRDSFNFALVMGNDEYVHAASTAWVKLSRPTATVS